MIIVVVANIYKDDYTEIQFGDIRKKIETTTGIRQGVQYLLKWLHIDNGEVGKRGKDTMMNIYH